MNEENIEIVCDSPILKTSVDNVVQMFKDQEEEVQKLDQKKCSLEVDIEHLKKICHYIELEKSEIDGDITRLRLRNLAYQKEHTNLRNSIKIAKFQIEKIKDSIAVAKANDLKALEDFEKDVDEITEKFRSGPVTYDRKVLLEKIGKEKEKRDALVKKLEEVRKSYEDFNSASGLRERTDCSEELLTCILPDSELSRFLEMTKTLDEVISGIRDITGEPKEGEKKLKILIHPAKIPETEVEIKKI